MQRFISWTVSIDPQKALSWLWFFIILVLFAHIVAAIIAPPDVALVSVTGDCQVAIER